MTRIVKVMVWVVIWVVIFFSPYFKTDIFQRTRMVEFQDQLSKVAELLESEESSEQNEFRELLEKIPAAVVLFF